MTAVGCDTVEVNPPQHSIKQREKCGLNLHSLEQLRELARDGVQFSIVDVETEEGVTKVLLA